MQRKNVIQIRVNDEEMATLRAMAKNRGKTVSCLLRESPFMKRMEIKPVFDAKIPAKIKVDKRPFRTFFKENMK